MLHILQDDGEMSDDSTLHHPSEGDGKMTDEGILHHSLEGDGKMTDESTLHHPSEGDGEMTDEGTLHHPSEGQSMLLFSRWENCKPSRLMAGSPYSSWNLYRIRMKKEKRRIIKFEILVSVQRTQKSTEWNLNQLVHPFWTKDMKAWRQRLSISTYWKYWLGSLYRTFSRSYHIYIEDANYYI